MTIMESSSILPVLSSIMDYIHSLALDFIAKIDYSQQSLYICLAAMTFNPIFWNVVARNEYHNKSLTKLFKNNYYGVYFLAVVIFVLGLIRDYLYSKAIESQPTLPILNHLYVKTFAASLFGTGNVFVLSSMWALGVTGTYLGDYFGILMKERVTCFPFSVLDNPMYYGSSMIFLSMALWKQSPAGILLSAYVFVVYLISLRFEGPFTAMIYSSKSSRKSKVATPAKRKSSRVRRKED